VTSTQFPDASSTPTDGTAPAPRRRRATRSAAAPAPTAQATTVPAESTARTTEAATPPAEPTTVSADAPTSAAPAGPTSADEQPARARTSRRSRSKEPAAASEPSAEPVAESLPAAEVAVAAPVAAPVAESDAAPATTRSRTSRSRRAVAPQPVPPVEEPSAEELADDEPVEQDAAPAAAVPAPVTVAPPAGASSPPRLATTALLFQAPDPAAGRPRRRRAQVGAGSPEEISQAARRAEALAAVPVDEPAVEELAVVPGETVGEDAGGGRSRSARRRRGRGRSGQDVDESPAEVLLDVPAPDDETAPDVVDDEDLVEPDEDETNEDETNEADDEGGAAPRRRRRRGGRGRRSRSETASPEGGPDAAHEGDEGDHEDSEEDGEGPVDEEGSATSRRRRRRRRGSRTESSEPETRPRARGDEVTALRGSTRLEAKRQRRREGRDAGRRRQIISEAEFLTRRESVDRTMVVRERAGRTQIAVLEDGVLVEHYVSNQAQASMVGNVYLGRVQNVLPSMEAAFVDVGKGRNAVLYAGEVNWDAAGLEGQPRRIEQALHSGDAVLTQVTKDPIGHKGARLTSQVTLAGRYLVLVPGGGMTGISRKLPEPERNRLKRILREIVPESSGVIVRTAAEGASEDELRADIARLRAQWEAIEARAKTASAPALLQGEPDMAIRVVRDIFNDDFGSLVVQGEEAWTTISGYIAELAPDLAAKVTRWTSQADVFAAHRVDEQLAKGLDRKVWLPSGGSLVIDRTEAMTVIDVNTGKFTGVGGTLEETVTRNNLEAAEEIVRQLRLRDTGGIIVIDFIDMVLESNRDLVLRRLVECLGRDRTKHQVAEVTSLGLVQMTRKRVGQGLVEAFSETCEHCHGRGFVLQAEPVERGPRTDVAAPQQPTEAAAKRSRRKRGTDTGAPSAAAAVPVLPQAREVVKATLATIAAAAAHAHEHGPEHHEEPLAAEPVAEPETTGSDVVVDEPVDPAAEAVEPQTPPATAPVLDVFAELAARPRLASDEVAPQLVPDEAGVDVELELTAVDPAVFAPEPGDDSATDDAAADPVG